MTDPPSHLTGVGFKPPNGTVVKNYGIERFGKGYTGSQRIMHWGQHFGQHFSNN